LHENSRRLKKTRLLAHPSDRQKWSWFLLDVHRNQPNPIDADTFGLCREAKHWLPDEWIPRLVGHCEKTMELLCLAQGRLRAME
jgi:hypothetical protein